MTRFLKGGYNVRSDGSGLEYVDRNYKLKIAFVNGYVYITPELEGFRKRVEEFIPENADSIFNKIKEIKQEYKQEAVKVVIYEEVFG